MTAERQPSSAFYDSWTVCGQDHGRGAYLRQLVINLCWLNPVQEIFCTSNMKNIYSVQNSGMNLVITGCNGFIGKALSEKCLDLGWSVKGTVRSAAKIPELPQRVKPVIVPDIGLNTDWSESLNLATAVVHLAAQVHKSKKAGGSSQKLYFSTNAAGTARLAMAAAKAGVQRLVFLSTLKVNGENRSEACRESDSEAPCGLYAVSKYEAEKVLREISMRTGLQTVILRPPLVYGPGVKANFLSLLRIVACRVPLPFRDIRNRRSLIYVGNLVDAIILSLRHPGAAGETFLIADDEAVSTPELIRRIADALRITPRLFSLPAKLVSTAAWMIGKGDELQRLTASLWADTSKIRFELGWHPKSTLNQGLQETASWYRAFRSAKHST